MNSDNSSSERRANGIGAPVLEPPAQAARVIPEPHMPTASQPVNGVPTYPVYSPPQAAQPAYQPQPISQQPETARKGVSPVVVILSILGALVLLGLLFLVAALFMISNAVGGLTNPAVGELRTEMQSVPLGEARSVVVDVSMGVGTLDVSGGAGDLMEATFTYNVDTWKPIVSYSLNAQGSEGTLLIEQPAARGINTSANIRNDWNVRFKDDVPMTMKVDMGVGQGNLRFGGLNLTRLEVNSGVGETTVDLTGLNAPQNVNVLVNAGVGKLTIILPENTGARVTADGGLGNINSGGLTANGKTYTNSAYGTTDHSINVDVKTGIGDISLIQGR
ncbi:MAG: toast rack family protein [Chloroflexota bacterium]